VARRVIGRDVWVAGRSIYRLARGKELHAPYPLSERVASWRRGFQAESAAIYDFAHNDARDYVNDYARLYRCPKINPLRPFFDHKLMMRVFLLSKGIPQAETIALIAGGDAQLFPLDDRARHVSTAELERWLLQDGGRYIVKPQDGTRGADVFLVAAEGGRLLRRRGAEARPFRAAASNGVTIVERVIEQGAFWRDLCPHSTNTIRAVTMWTPGDSEPFLGVAVQRMGRADTAPTDNWSGGGICARIDLSSGRLGVGRMHPRKGKLAQTVYTHHPETGAPIEGAVLPHWDRIRETVRKAAASSVVHRYVGWDVAVDRDGVPVIIEGNNNTDLDLLQVHGGLLADPRVRRFYENYGAA